MGAPVMHRYGGDNILCPRKYINEDIFQLSNLPDTHPALCSGRWALGKAYPVPVWRVPGQYS